VHGHAVVGEQEVQAQNAPLWDPSVEDQRGVDVVIYPIHPNHCLLSSRRRGQYKRIKAGTERLKNSFYFKAIRLLNSHHKHIEAAA
jgi:hypothetical protein